MKEFILYLTANCGYSAGTVKVYQADLNQFSAFLQSANIASYCSVTTEIVNNFVATLMMSGLNPRTVRRKLSCLKSFYRFLWGRGKIQENPALYARAPKFSRPLPAILSARELQSLLAPQPSQSSSYRACLQRTFVAFLVLTGCRLSEALSLTIGNVDFHRNVVRVFGKGAKWREVPLSPMLSDILTTYLGARAARFPEEYKCPVLFLNEHGCPMKDRAARSFVEKCLEQVAPGRKATPHTLRHSIATYLASQGASLSSIQQLLGHASIMTTQIYLNLSQAQVSRDYYKAVASLGR